jgi:hypothetical protein
MLPKAGFFAGASRAMIARSDRRRLIMDDARYWWDEAAKLKQYAETAEDPSLREELHELARVCEEVSAAIEARSPGG